jgi:hypothetical protein
VVWNEDLELLSVVDRTQYRTNANTGEPVTVPYCITKYNINGSNWLVSFRMSVIG